jgi:hypothetical protein
MSSIKSTTISLTISDSGSGGGHSTTDNDEIKIFECEKHEEDNADRLSPVIKEEEEVRKTIPFVFQIELFFFSSRHPLVCLFFDQTKKKKRRFCFDLRSSEQ